MITYNYPIVVLTLLPAILTSLASGINVVHYGRCMTPNSESAYCIQLQQCSYLYNMIKADKKSLSDSDRVFLQRSQCGSNNGTVLICCPERQIDEQMTPDSTDTRLRALLPEPGTCGKVLADRIIGGNVTKIDEYPWMALIEYTEEGNSVGHRCGGSLINDRYVLTAAHCIKQVPETVIPSRVRLGEWDLETDNDCQTNKAGHRDCADPHVDVEIEKVITHENYVATSKNQPYDIALLRLSRSIPYTDFIKPICLPVKDILKRSTFEGDVMDVSGWGLTEDGTPSKKKLKAGLPIVPFAECQRIYNQSSNVDLMSTQMCAGGVQGIDACRGDSGGPLIGLDSSNKKLFYNFIAGIVSFGPKKCGFKDVPGIFTRVSDYIDWINKNIEP